MPTQDLLAEKTLNNACEDLVSIFVEKTPEATMVVKSVQEDVAIQLAP